MNKKNIIVIGLVTLSLAALILGYPHRAHASSSYYTSMCTGCHGASSPSTCNGCHSHGTHPDSNKSSLNITASTDKTSYQPGEAISVTVSGGYRTGWARAVLYDQNMVELARSTGTVVSGAIAPSGAPSFPVTLRGAAPATPGTYTFNASWYGNKYDKSGGYFGPRWRPDPTNPNHGEEIVATNSFTVVSSTPAPAPAITVTDSVSPATDLIVAFGTVYSGSSANQTVTVKNTGTANLVVGTVGSGNALAAPFSVKTDTCSGQTLAASASCTITLGFAPSSVGSFSDSFSIPSNDPANSTVTVSLTGSGTAAPVPAIAVSDSVSPTTDLLVPFGSVNAGTSATQTVTVKNTGTANLVLATIGSGNALAAPFSVKTDACSGQTLAPSASCTVVLAFAPQATGTFSDSFAIPSNDPVNGTVTVSVTGSGTVAPVPAISVTDSVSPTTDLLVPFGSVNAGTSATQMVTVKNTGTANLVVGAVGSTNALTAPFSVKTDTCSSQTLLPSATCTITLAFGPSATGTFTDSFNIPSNDPASPSVTINVNGTGAAASVPHMTVTDAVAPATDLAMNFGSVLAGTSKELNVTVTNEGNAGLVLGSIGSTDPLAAPFSISADACSGRTLAPAASCSITVRFAPSAAGLFSESFNIPGNDPANPSFTMSVSGQGQSEPVPDIAVLDSAAPNNDLLVPFGSMTAGLSSVQTLTVRNDGNANLVIGTIGSSNPVAAPFSIKTDGCSGQTLAPASSCLVTLQFAPAATGNFADSLDIPSNDPDEASVVVNVNGIGASMSVPDIKVTDGIAPVDDLQVPFGDVRAGRAVDSLVTVSNAADGQLVIGTIASTNAVTGPFSILSNACSGKTLAVGETCTLTVRFTAPETCSPAANNDGNTLNRCSYSDSFDIPSNDPDEQDLTIAVSGNSIPGAGNVPPGKPRLRYPADGQTGLRTSFDAKWDASIDPDGDVVTYELRVSQDREFSNSINFSSTGRVANTAGQMLAGSGLGFLVFGLAFVRNGRGWKSLLIVMALAAAGAAGLAACSSSGSTALPAPEVVRHLDGLKTDTTYYWKVVASDGKGGVTASDVYTFSTK